MGPRSPRGDQDSMAPDVMLRITYADERRPVIGWYSAHKAEALLEHFTIGAFEAGAVPVMVERVTPPPPPSPRRLYKTH